MDCGELKYLLTNWFSTEIECQQNEHGLLSIVLPVFKPNGDAIEVGLYPSDAGWTISDLGDTQEFLYLAGVDLSGESDRRDEFEHIVGDHGLIRKDGELSVHVSSNIGDGLFDFVAALQSLHALHFTIRTRQPKRDFASIVAKFLAEQHASFEVCATEVEGKAGLPWKFNFSLNHVRKETLVKAITATTATEALKSSEQAVFEMSDVLAVRKDVDVLAIVDDEDERERFWKERTLRLYKSYGIPVLTFSAERESLTQFARKYVPVA